MSISKVRLKRSCLLFTSCQEYSRSSGIEQKGFIRGWISLNIYSLTIKKRLADSWYSTSLTVSKLQSSCLESEILINVLIKHNTNYVCQIYIVMCVCVYIHIYMYKYMIYKHNLPQIIYKTINQKILFMPGIEIYSEIV